MSSLPSPPPPLLLLLLLVVVSGPEGGPPVDDDGDPEAEDDLEDGISVNFVRTEALGVFISGNVGSCHHHNVKISSNTNTVTLK